MNKRIIASVLIITMVLGSFCACSSKKKKEDKDDSVQIPMLEETSAAALDTTEITRDPREIYVPEINQIQSICELAVLECYYHNVARGVIAPGTGFTHWGEKEKEFWIEYSAYITFGIDFNKVTMDIDGDNIVVHVPRAEVLGDVRTDENSFSTPIYAPGSMWENDVQIHASDINDAVAIANQQLLIAATEDTAALSLAESRVQALIENYISQIMQLSGVDYNLTVEFYNPSVD